MGRDFPYTFIAYKSHSLHKEKSDALIHPQVTFCLILFFHFISSLIQFAFVTPQMWGIYEQSKSGVSYSGSWNISNLICLSAKQDVQPPFMTTVGERPRILKRLSSASPKYEMRKLRTEL